jgi:Phosphoserine phosphatase RsbU, N-terminal domain
VDALRRDYRIAFLRYLPSRDEAALALGYQIGRASVADGTGVLILTQIHHEILREVVAESPAEEVDHLIERAAEFIAEVLGSVEMVQRSLRTK